MRAVDLAENIPLVHRGTTGAQAARVMAEYRLPGLVVADDDGQPVTVIRGSRFLEIVVPQYVRDDHHLAHAIDEAGADEICDRLKHATIGELLDSRKLKLGWLPSVLPEDTVIEIASVMVKDTYPLILCADRDGTYQGTILLSRVLGYIAQRAGEDSELVRERMTHDVISPGDACFPTSTRGAERPTP